MYYIYTNIYIYIHTCVHIYINCMIIKKIYIYMYMVYMLCDDTCGFGTWKWGINHLLWLCCVGNMMIMIDAWIFGDSIFKHQWSIRLFMDPSRVMHHSQNWPSVRTLRDVAKRTGGQVGFHFHHHIVPGNLSSTGPGWVLDDLFRSLGMASNGENPMAELNRTQVSQAAF